MRKSWMENEKEPSVYWNAVMETLNKAEHTVDTLAVRIGITDKTLSSFLKGSRVTWRTFQKIKNWYDVLKENDHF